MTYATAPYHSQKKVFRYLQTVRFPKRNLHLFTICRKYVTWLFRRQSDRKAGLLYPPRQDGLELSSLAAGTTFLIFLGVSIDPIGDGVVF